MNEVQCAECPRKDDCSSFSLLNNTLDKKKKHIQLNINLSYLISLNSLETFEEDFEDIMEDTIAEPLALLNSLIVKSIAEVSEVCVARNGKVEVKKVSNKTMFKTISEHIKETHV